MPSNIIGPILNSAGTKLDAASAVRNFIEGVRRNHEVKIAQGFNDIVSIAAYSPVTQLTMRSEG